MKQQKSLKKNFLMNALLTTSSFLFPLITFPYVSRVLLPGGNGKVTAAVSLVSYFSLLAQLGIPTYGVRVCAKIRDDRQALTRTVHELMGINLVMSFLSYGLFLAILLSIPKLRKEKALYLVVSITILLGAMGMEWLYIALEQYRYITIRSLIFKLIALAATFLLIHQESDYVLYGAITVFAASASNVFNLLHAHRFVSFRPVGGYDFRRHIRPALVFFWMTCATTIYTNLDNVMLYFMTSDQEVGYYHAAVRIKSILVSLITSLGAVVLPRASYYVENGQLTEFKRIIKKSVNFVLLAAAPMMVYFILFARAGIYFLSGRAFEGSVMPMRLIMPTLLLVGLSNITGIQTLIPLGREKAVLMSEIAGAVTDVCLNALLIPHLAASGAAIGTLISEMVVLGIQYHALADTHSDLLKDLNILRILGGILLGTAASIWVLLLPVGSFLTLLISAGLFFGVYGGFLLLGKEPLIMELIQLLHRLPVSNKAGR